MRAELRIDGGVGFFPGLARPITLDGSDLSPDERDEFSRLVSAIRALPGAAPGATVKAVPDGRTYRITISSGDGNIELRCADAALPPAFSALMVFIKQHGHR
ncbi:protealysin inhibitor emfourin [Caballeronia sp. dw_276]|uniref:protealysin inhibitor emfourin n=1 Tax=Caballeronia sp. dw_276 TaxID=2719795 RepID=UPI001BD43853|nr:protealysin inhibitor emfourin [Caballeronia sp. dw_276]